ncbi:hypothetical protein ACED96_08410 [Clostridium thermobutyricum]
MFYDKFKGALEIKNEYERLENGWRNGTLYVRRNINLDNKK